MFQNNIISNDLGPTTLSNNSRAQDNSGLSKTQMKSNLDQIKRKAEMGDTFDLKNDQQISQLVGSGISSPEIIRK
jgi:hypothetical protein|tara:strand:+ start:589 stop:813 length:225 start_codon:yes stop_codon:yes gene_type:complete